MSYFNNAPSSIYRDENLPPTSRPPPPYSQSTSSYNKYSEDYHNYPTAPRDYPTRLAQENFAKNLINRPSLNTDEPTSSKPLFYQDANSSTKPLYSQNSLQRNKPLYPPPDVALHTTKPNNYSPSDNYNVKTKLLPETSIRSSQSQPQQQQHPLYSDGANLSRRFDSLTRDSGTQRYLGEANNPPDYGSNNRRDVIFRRDYNMESSSGSRENTLSRKNRDPIKRYSGSYQTDYVHTSREGNELSDFSSINRNHYSTAPRNFSKPQIVSDSEPNTRPGSGSSLVDSRYSSSPRRRFRTVEDYHYDYRGGYRPSFDQEYRMDGYTTDGSGSGYQSSGRGYENYRYPESEALLGADHRHSFPPYQQNGATYAKGKNNKINLLLIFLC